MRNALWLLIAVGCGSSSPPTSTKGGVTVELASVTLADDCGDGGWRPPPKPDRSEKTAAKDESKEDAQERMSKQASCPKGVDCNVGRSRGCDQTSMQLSFKATDAATVRIKKVELLDDGGKSISELASRLPTRWNGSAYVVWDEKLAANSTLQTSYLLAEPPWKQLGGRMESTSKKFQLRVVLDVGGTDFSVEKQSIAPAMMQPEVMTQR